MTPEQRAEIRARADAAPETGDEWCAAVQDRRLLLDDNERLEAEVERLRAKVERVEDLVETWLNRNISWRSSAEYVQAALDGEG